MTLEHTTEIATDNPKPKLEEFGFEENNKLYWWASWFAKILEYKSLRTLEPTILKAKDSCVQLGLSIEDNFIRTKRKTDGIHKNDFKLSKFACFLIAMHADTRKPVVKRAQLYFYNDLEELSLILKGQNFIERKIGRDEIKELSGSLNKSAARSKVKDYRYFINEGFLGMYNHTVGEIKQERGIPQKGSLYDHLGNTELAAHIFRIALTNERLRHLRNPSEEKAAREHWKIGAQIRALIKEHAKVYPESLPTKESLKTLERNLKKAARQLNSIAQKSISS